MNIERFTHNHFKLLKDFSCGNIVLDNFIKSNNALDNNQGVTYLLLSDDKDFIIGYYNISAGRVDRIEIINNCEYYIPMGGSVNINYLAIHKDYQRIKLKEIDNCKIYLGDFLLRDCERRIVDLSKHLGIAFITLNSTEEGYHLYHIRNGYENFEDDMNSFVPETDKNCYKLYKCIDDII